MSGNCGDCKHWNQAAVREQWELTIRTSPYDDTWDDDRSRDAENQFGRCERINMHDSFDVLDPQALPLALLKDGSNYTANIYTRLRPVLYMIPEPPTVRVVKWRIDWDARQAWTVPPLGGTNE